MLSRFDTIPERDGQTDGQTEFLSSVSIAVLTCDKNGIQSKSIYLKLLVCDHEVLVHDPCPQ